MRHQKKGKLLGRNSNERKNLIRGLITSLVLNGKVTTSDVNGKVLKRSVDKMINDALKNEDLKKEKLYKWVPNKKVVETIIEKILPFLEGRKTGLTSLYHIGVREGDNTKIVQIEWIISKPEITEKKLTEKSHEKK